jgi:hypothetical protein
MRFRQILPPKATRDEMTGTTVVAAALPAFGASPLHEFGVLGRALTMCLLP